MFNNSQIQNILGTLYTSGALVFHPTQSKIYTPLANRVKCVDLKNNITHILNIEANRDLKLITINPQGSILVLCDVKNHLIIYNLLAEFVIGRISFKGNVSAIQFSDDGKLFAIAEERGFRVYLSPPFWRSLEPLVLIKKYTNRHSLPITGLKFSPDSRFLLTHGLQPKIFLNNLISLGKQFTAPSFQVHKYPIVDCFFENKEMQRMYTVDKGGNLLVWRWSDERSSSYTNRFQTIRRKLNQRRGVTSDSIKKQMVQESDEDQKQIIEHDLLELETKQGQIQKFKQYSEFQKKALSGRFILDKKLIVSQPASQVTHCQYLPKINLLATTHTSGRFAIWKLQGNQLQQIYNYSIGNHEISSLAISPDGHWIVLGIQQTGQLVVWEWRSQTYIINQSGRLIDGICSQISPNHNVIAVGTQHGKVRIWDRVTGFCLTTFAQQHQGEVTAIKFSNPTTLFSSSLDGTVQAYDLNKYKRFRVFKPDKKAQLTSLAVDEAGEMICAGSFDPYEVYCWNIQTARLLQVITGHTGPITCLTFVGQQLFTGGWDRHLRIHEFYSRRMNTQTLDHGSQINSIAIHPHKNQIAVATLRGEVYLWKVPDTSQLVGILDCQSYWKKTQDAIPITSISYSADCSYLAVGGKNKDLLIFDIKFRTLVRRICLTNNTNYKGVQQFLNSKMIRQGVNMADIQVYSDDDRLPEQSLPGSKKLDISKQERQLEVSVHSIGVSQNNFYVGTSFGVLIFGTPKKFKFSPFQIQNNSKPEDMIQQLKSHNYTNAMAIALGLGIPISKLIKKIPLKSIVKIVDQLGEDLRDRLIVCFSEVQLNELNLLWVKSLLNYDVRLPKQMLVGFERLKIIDGLVNKIGATIDAGQLLKHQIVQEKAEEER